MSKANDILRKYSDYSDIAIDDALSAMREAMEEAFKAGYNYGYEVCNDNFTEEHTEYICPDQEAFINRFFK